MSIDKQPITLTLSQVNVEATCNWCFHCAWNISTSARTQNGKFSFNLGKSESNRINDAFFSNLFTMHQHSLTLLAKYFDLVKSGKKLWEGRVNDGKCSLIKAGDIIKFAINPQTPEDNKRLNESVAVSVVTVHHYTSFEEMLKDSGVEAYLPLSDEERSKSKCILSLSEAVDLYRSFPTYAEREIASGVLGIQLTLMN